MSKTPPMAARARSPEVNPDQEQQTLEASWLWRWKHKVGHWLESSRLFLYTLLLLLSSVGNALYFKRMTTAMPNYCWFLTQITTFFYLPLFLTLAGFNSLKSQTSRGVMYSFGIMGALDGLAGVLMVLGGSHTSGTMQVVLAQGVIPFTLLGSVVLLSKRFHTLQYSGAVGIILGIIIANISPSDASGVASDMPVFNLIFFFSVVPTALSSVYKEVAFRGFEGDLDVNVLQFWVALFQMVINVCSAPVYSLRMLGPQQVPLSGMHLVAAGGSKCLFLQENSIVDNCGGEGQRPCDHCYQAWIAVGAYCAFNLAYNVFTMLVIKHGSATLSFLVATLRMPLSSIAFSQRMLVGPDAVAFTFNDFVSLLIIICGLYAYRRGHWQLIEQRKLEQEAIMSPSAYLLGRTPSDAGTPSVGTRRQRWRLVPMFSFGQPVAQPVFVLRPELRPQPRSAERVRSDLYSRLGAASPLHSPKLRHMSPPLGRVPSGAGLNSLGVCSFTPRSHSSPRSVTPSQSPSGSDRHTMGARPEDSEGEEEGTKFSMSGLPGQSGPDAL